jgi:hypothetical protein
VRVVGDKFLGAKEVHTWSTVHQARVLYIEAKESNDALIRGFFERLETPCRPKRRCMAYLSS